MAAKWKISEQLGTIVGTSSLTRKSAAPFSVLVPLAAVLALLSADSACCKSAMIWVADKAAFIRGTWQVRATTVARYLEKCILG